MSSRDNSSKSLADARAAEDSQKMRHPDMMSYTDGDGVKHEIYIPARDYYKCTLHFVKEEWDELAKFPKWSESTEIRPSKYVPKEVAKLTRRLQRQPTGH